MVDVFSDDDGDHFFFTADVGVAAAIMKHLAGSDRPGGSAGFDDTPGIFDPCVLHRCWPSLLDKKKANAQRALCFVSL